VDQPPVFVSSEYCLACRGCCRFTSVDSPWRPRIGAGEDFDWLTPEARDDQGYVKADQTAQGIVCRLLDPVGHLCRVYARRPFECRMYPVILTRADGQWRVYLHLSCPYVQEHYGSEACRRYIQALKDYFQGPGVRAFLRRNSDLAGDYAGAEEELVEVLRLDP